MTAPIAAIAAVAPLAGAAGVAAPAAASVPSAAAGSGANFATALANGLDAVSAAQSNADTLAIQSATGALADPAQYEIAATQASLMTQMATTLETKAVAAFNTIMGMQA